MEHFGFIGYAAMPLDRPDPPPLPATGGTAVDKALLLLMLVGEHADRGAVRLVDLVELSGLRKPTVHRLLGRLKAFGLVEQHPGTGRYGLGGTVPHLARRFLSQGSLLERFARHAAELRKIGGPKVLTAVPDGTGGVTVFRIGERGVEPVARVWRYPFRRTALGHVLMAFGVPFDDAADDRTGNARPLLPLESIRRRGYVIDDQTNEPGIRELAVVVRGIRRRGGGCPGAARDPDADHADQPGPLAGADPRMRHRRQPGTGIRVDGQRRAAVRWNRFRVARPAAGVPRRRAALQFPLRRTKIDSAHPLTRRGHKNRSLALTGREC